MSTSASYGDDWETLSKSRVHLQEPRHASSFAQLSRAYYGQSTVSVVESDDSEVDMGKLKKGLRALSSPSDAA